MDFPEAFTSKVISQLSPGLVIKCPVDFDNASKPVIKRLVILTCNNKETILTLTSTSQKFAATRYFAKDDIYLAPGDEAAFEEPTYIQLHRVISLDTPKLILLFKESKLGILDKISDELFDQILKKIDKSDMIEGKYRKRILEENKHY